LSEYRDTVYNGVNEYFDSKETFLEYWERFKQLKDAKARQTLDNICQNIRLIKELEDSEFELPQQMALIVITSIIEALHTTVPFQNFGEWLSRHPMCKTMDCRRLWGKYNEVFGCSHKFRKFFLKYLTNYEKADLIRKIMIVIDGATYVPFCYQGEVCKISDEYENSDFYTPQCKFTVNSGDCTLIKNERKMKNVLRKFCNFLYSLRRQFLHEGRLSFFITKIHSKLPVLAIHDVVKTREHTGWITNWLSTEFLLSLLKRNLQRMLGDYCEQNSV
jgi:hypothetical protein